MIYELESNEFKTARPLFAGLKDRVAIHATFEGNCSGRIFVDDVADPSTAFVWNEFRYGYLVGDPENDAFSTSLQQLLADTLLPEARDSHDPTLLLYPYPESWGDKIRDLVGNQPVINLARRTFNFSPARFQYHEWQNEIPSGFHVRCIDMSLLSTSGRKIVDGIQVLWRSLDDFLENGAGFCLLDGDDVVSTCFSVFAGGGKREIGVDTHPQYRRRGFATLAASAFIAQCLRDGVEPAWECWADNAPSVELAKKLGFERVRDYPVYFIDLEPERGHE